MDGLVQQSSAHTSNADVAVVMFLFGQWDVEADAETRNEIALRFTVVDDGVDDSDGL